MRDLCNRFLTSKKRLVDTGELSSITWRDYYAVCEKLVESFGASRLIFDLGGEDFEKLRSELAKTRGPVGLGTSIQRMRTVFKYAYDENLIDRPIRFGSSFQKPSRKAVRKARNESGPRMFEAGEIRQMLDSAKQPLKAMILLGINAGYGQTDVANLPITAIDFTSGWICFPRPKTGIMRKCVLWQETISALREAINQRPEAKNPADSGLAFITKFGMKWVRLRQQVEGGGVLIDSVRLEFNKLTTKLVLGVLTLV